MKLIKAVGLIGIAALCMGFQAPDDEEQRLPGQPDRCNNYAATVHKCACSRAMMACRTPGDRAKPNASCSTYCRPSACSCSGPNCTSRKMKM